MDENPNESSDEPNCVSAEAEIQRVCGLLESVAKRFAPNSDEGIAIKDAAIAFAVVQLHRSMKKSFDKLRIASGGELTNEMKADLQRHGIDFSDLDDDQPESTDSI